MNGLENKNVVVVRRDESIRDYSDSRKIEEMIASAFGEYIRKTYSTDNLSDVIKQGDKIVIKPNLVNEMNFRVRFDSEIMENPNDCFITNWCFIRGVVRILSCINNLFITILECPLQSCNMDKIVTDEMIDELRQFNISNVVKFVDARRTKYIYTQKAPIIKHDCRGESNYIDFDLKGISLHSKYEDKVERFRVTDYPPSEMKKFHGKDKHIYRIAKEIIDADIIINIPKLKTHMKAGMTNAMKNFVGIVGNKECLPHHIKGSKFWGGDCYGDFSLLKLLSEELIDWANSYMLTDEKKSFWARRIALSFMLIRWYLCLDKDITGSWYGNDTICRTIVDLNKIVYYGSLDGEICSSPQRKVFSIIDAIVSGQDEGPMRPIPNYTGFIAISESTALADSVCAELIGIESKKIHYLFPTRICDKTFPLSCEGKRASVFVNELAVSFSDLKAADRTIQMPPRWVGRFEYKKTKRFTYLNEFISGIVHYPSHIKEIQRKTKKEMK